MKTEPSIILEATEVLSPETELLPNEPAGERFTAKDVERVTRERFTVEVPQPKAEQPAPVTESKEATSGERKEEPPTWKFEHLRSRIKPDTKITVCVTRRPDGFENKGVFLKPCNTTMDCDPVRYEQTMELEDIYTIVKEREESGGNFYFQIRAGTGFTDITWDATLSNPKVEARPEPAASIPAPPVAVTDQPNPLDAVIAQANKIRELRAAIMGGEEQRQTQPTTTQPAPVDPFIQLLAERMRTDVPLQDKVIEYFFKKDEPGESESTIGSIIKEVLHNPQGAFELLGGALQAISVMRGNQLQQPQGGQPSPIAAPQNGSTVASAPPSPQIPQPLFEVFQILAEDLSRDANVSRAADAVQNLMASDEHYAGLASQIINTDPNLNLKQLAQFTGMANLPVLPHALAWLNYLREELASRMESAATAQQPTEQQPTEQPTERISE
jgi:hypothetical protein